MLLSEQCSPGDCAHNCVAPLYPVSTSDFHRCMKVYTLLHLQASVDAIFGLFNERRIDRDSFVLALVNTVGEGNVHAAVYMSQDLCR